MAGFLEGFSEEASEWLKMMGSQVQQQASEKKAEERQIRAENRRIINLERELDIREDFNIRAVEKAQNQKKELMDLGMQLNKNMEEWKAQFNARLEASLYDPSFEKMQKKAQTDPIQWAYMKAIEGEIGKVMQGKTDVNMEVLEGMPPVAKMKVQAVMRENVDRERNYQLQKANYDRQIKALDEQIAYHKELQASRETMDEKRIIDTLTGLDKRIEGADEKFTEEFRTVMSDLEENKIIDSKGRLKVGGIFEENPQLLDPETGSFDEEVLARLIEKHPRYAMRFRRLFTLQANLMRQQMMKDSYLEEGSEEAEESNTWTGADGNVYEVGKTYTIGGRKVKCVGVNQFEPVT